MTLQEAKDKVAIRHRFKDWEDVVLQFQAKNYVDEVAVLYALSKWDECYEEIQNDILESSPGNYIPDKPEFKP